MDRLYLKRKVEDSCKFGWQGVEENKCWILENEKFFFAKWKMHYYRLEFVKCFSVSLSLSLSPSLTLSACVCVWEREREREEEGERK